MIEKVKSGQKLKYAKTDSGSSDSENRKESRKKKEGSWGCQYLIDKYSNPGWAADGEEDGQNSEDFPEVPKSEAVRQAEEL